MMRAFIAWIDRRHFISVRGLTLYTTLGLTVYVTAEAFRFAAESKLPGLDIAAILAAVTAPVCALQKFTFDTYASMKKDGQ